MEQERLGAIRTKIANDIAKKEQEIKELRSRLHSVDVALGLLFEEREAHTGTKVIELRKDKYKTMGLSDAIRDCVNVYGATRQLSTAEISKYLKDNGIQSKSKYFYQTVFSTLARLAENREIERVKGKWSKKTILSHNLLI